MHGGDNMELRNIIKNKDANTVLLLVGIAVAILVLAVIFTVGPLVGYNVESAVTIPTTSSWSSASNTAITNGSEMWAQNTPMLAVAALISIVGIIIAILMGVAKPNP
jgi:hypothetical protein